MQHYSIAKPVLKGPPREGQIVAASSSGIPILISTLPRTSAERIHSRSLYRFSCTVFWQMGP